MFDVDPATLSGEELTAHLRTLDGLQQTLERARTAALLEWDCQQVWADDGSVTAGARLARETGVAASTARERVRVTQKLPRMPLVRAAFDDDRIGWSKVRLLAAALTDRTEEAFTACEAVLVGQAERLTVDQLALFLRHWNQVVDEDGANADADAMHDGRYVQLAKSWQGEGFLKGRLDPEGRAIVAQALETIGEELYRANRSEARAALEAGDAPASPTAGQRMADALVEISRRAMAATDAAASGATVVPARPLVGVTMDIDDYRTIRARLQDGTPLPEATARRLLCDAAIFRVLTRGGSVPIDLGRATREPSEAQRRAAGALWPTCTHPTCDRPFAWCELHHIIHWADGGPTDLDNLIPLCVRHHHLHHAGAFTIARQGDGAVVFLRPDRRVIGTANPTIPELLAPRRGIDPAA